MILKSSTIILVFFLFVLPFLPLAQAAVNHDSTYVNTGMQVQNDFTEYMKNVQEKLNTNWQPPDFMEEGHVTVHFRLTRQGKIISTSVIESSGNDIYDESAIEAIKESAPFAEFPDESSKEYISIKYSFDTILIEEERMNGYYELAKRYAKNNPQMALRYLDMAIDKVGGEEASCFLYKRRAEIKESLGDIAGAKADYETYNTYTNRTNIKRVHLLKHLAETKPSVYIYHYLAYAYEQVNEYDNAIEAIDKAIMLSNSDFNLKRYRNSLVTKMYNFN